MAEALLSVENLSATAGGAEVVSKVSFTLAPGQLAALVGPNGAGKSTLARAVLQLWPYTGEVRFQGQRLRSQGGTPAGIGYVPQALHVERTFPLTVEEFLYLCRSPRLPWWFRPNSHHRRIAETLGQIHAEALRRKPIGGLSGGEMQRVLLAQALLNEPCLLILDEPSSALDIGAQERLYALLRELATERSLAILMISHDIEAVLETVDWVICLRREIQCQGPPAHLREHEHLSRILGVGQFQGSK